MATVTSETREAFNHSGILIALDYDGTYTADPKLWDLFISQAIIAGHDVKIVTLRHRHEPIDLSGIEIIYTGRIAKAVFLKEMGLTPNIWIDDSPHWIYSSST